MSDPIAHVLILDDDVDVACAAEMLLRRRFGGVQTLSDPARLPDLLSIGVPDVVLLDFNFTPGRTDGGEGLAVLDILRALPNPPAIIAMTAYADVPLAVEALKRGANDFITKPWDNARLIAAVDTALTRREARGKPPVSNAHAELMGNSPAMIEIKSIIASVGPTEANVIVLGENGVGKELVARAIHNASQRAKGSFLAVDMGTLPESTFESELFGHRKGAFTDARSDRAGRFQTARGGSLFLDEIGNMPLSAQSKLLTVLERREVTPVGADRPEAIDVRIISATNLDETQLFNPAVFRPDLLFRLNTIVIRVPALRERREDIPGLLTHYLACYQQQYQNPAREMTQALLEILCDYSWPGNVRALRHACERAVILCKSNAYSLEDFGLQTNAAPIAAPLSIDAKGPSVDGLKLDKLERDAVSAALAQAEGNISRAAKLLGLSRTALYRKLDKHGL